MKERVRYYFSIKFSRPGRVGVETARLEDIIIYLGVQFTGKKTLQVFLRKMRRRIFGWANRWLSLPWRMKLIK